MQIQRTTIQVAIAGLLIATLPGMVVAQQRSARPGQDLDQTMVALTEQLELNEDQASQIRQLLSAQNTESRKMMEEMRASGEGRAGMGAMRERMDELRKGTHAKIKGILSAEQMVRYEEFVTKREESRSRQRGQRGRPEGQGGS